MNVLNAANELLETVEESLWTRREGLRRSSQELLEFVQARLDGRPRGENFNAFQVLGLDYSEHAHSRFISELLDPRGSHDQGTAFLELFLKQVGRADQFNARTAKVKREKFLGRVVMDGKNSRGGRVDIFVTENSRHVSIENKIRTEEGDEQVTRYCNFPGNFVLFLTVDRKPARRKELPNYSPISYPEHILPWLEACQRHAFNSPVLRETIKHYIISVRRMTGSFNMHQSDKQIGDAIRQHPAAAIAIRDTIDAVLSEELAALAEEVEKRMQEDGKGSEWTIQVRPVEQSYGGLYVKRASWGDTWVTWAGDSRMKEASCLGIRRSKESSDPWEGATGFSERFPGMKGSGSGEWPYWRSVDAPFTEERGFTCLLDNDWRKDFANEVVRELVELARYCDEKLGNGSS